MTLRAWCVPAISAALAVAATGCGTPGGTGRSVSPRVNASHPASPSYPAVTQGCGSLPPRHAWAAEVTSAGQVAWRTPVPVRGTAGFGPAIPPLVAGTVGVFAQDGKVHGISLADGREAWSWGDGEPVYGMWRWQSLVVVLTQQVGANARLTGLDAANGGVGWTRRLPGGLLGGQFTTADGGLAILGTNGVLQVVDLGDGRVRWSRFAGRWPGLAAADGVVMFAMGERLTGYDDRTGTIRWKLSGLPGQTQVQAMAGLALVTSNGSGPFTRTALVAVDPANGRIAWQFDPGPAVTPLSAGPAGLAAATYVPARRFYLLDPRTGRPRWGVTTAAVNTVPLVTRTRVISVEGGMAGFPTVRLVSRSAASGAVLWARRLSTTPAGVQPVLLRAGDAVVQTAPRRAGQPAPLLAYDLATGKPAWTADMPTFVQVPPVPVHGGLLVQPADPPEGCASTG